MSSMESHGWMTPYCLVPVLTMAPVLVLLLLIGLSPASAAEGDLEVYEPINITGNEEMDAFSDWSSGDGLSPETAYILDNVSIDGEGAVAAIVINGTDRHLRIRDCRLYITSGGKGSGLYLEGCRNVSVWDNEFPGTGSAIVIVRCQSIQVVQNTITNQSSNGILVDRSRAIIITLNEISWCDEAVTVRDSRDVMVIINEITASDWGIYLYLTNGCSIQTNEIWWNVNTGIHVDHADNNSIYKNHIHSNGLSGLKIKDSSDNDVAENVIEDNYQGIWLSDANRNVIDDNNLTGNGASGLRLTNSDDNEISSNTIRGNGPLGIDLEDSAGNTFTNNSIISNFRGISFSGSTGNTFIENRLIGNFMAAYEGDTSGNTFEGNELRANGWLMGLLVLTVVLVIIGIVLGVYFWIKRRRKVKDEKGKILIRTRFPPGRKGLWALSKYLWDEDFFRSSLESAGPQREQVLERYQQSIDSARMMQYMLVGFMAVFLAFMAAIPLAGLLRLITMDIDGANANDALFATGMAFGLYYVMSLVVLLVFGVLFLAQLMKGENFRLLATLPMDQKGNRRVVLYMLLRMYAAPYLVMLLALPIGGFLLTWSLTFLIVCLLVNLLVLTFLAFLLVLTADALSRRVFSANTSRGSTVIRVVVMASYMAVMMTVFIALQYLVGLVSDLYVGQRLAGESGELINALVSLVPFPFSGGYLVGLTVMPSDVVPPMIYGTTLVGMGLLVLITYAIRRVSQRVLERVARGQEILGTGPGHVATAADIQVVTRRPIPAFIRNGLLVTSRDMGSIIYLVMPILFPFIIIISMISEIDLSMFDPLFPYVMYLGVTAFLVNMALSSADANVGGILSAMPYRTMDQYRARWATMAIFMIFPLVIILFVFINRVPDPASFTALMLTMVSFVIALSSLYLVTFSLAFGSINRRHTFFMVRIDKKLAKYIGIMALQYALVILVLGAFWFLYTAGSISFGAGIAAIWVVNLSLFLILEVAARRLFN